MDFGEKVSELNLDLTKVECSLIRLFNIHYIRKGIFDFIESNPISDDEADYWTKVYKTINTNKSKQQSEFNYGMVESNSIPYDEPDSTLNLITKLTNRSLFQLMNLNSNLYLVRITTGLIFWK